MSTNLTAAAARALGALRRPEDIGHAPSTVCAVFDADGLVDTHASGSPRRDGRDATVDTVFRIASMSKSFLVATAMSLAEDGALALDAPVTEYVPAFRTTPDPGRAGQITLRMLMSNSGGLVEDNPWGDEHLGEPEQALLGDLGGAVRPGDRPGSTYTYSNFGQSLVGRAIERVTGRAVQEVVDQSILTPLGLQDTHFEPDEYPSGASLATGWRTFDQGRTWHPEPYVANGALGCIGALFSTVGDIARWSSFLRSAFTDRPLATDVLSARARREMQTLHSVNTGVDQHAWGRELDAVGYGYGLVVEHDHRFGHVVGHAGGLPGFGSHMRWHVDSGIGVVAFANSDSSATGALTSMVLDEVLTTLDAPARRVRVWPETLSAARDVDRVVTSGTSFADLTTALGRNLMRNVPVPVRDARLSDLLRTLGGPADSTPPLEERLVCAPDPASLRWTVPTGGHTLICDIRMMGASIPFLQSLTVDRADGSGRRRIHTASNVVDHHLPLLPGH